MANKSKGKLIGTIIAIVAGIIVIFALNGMESQKSSQNSALGPNPQFLPPQASNTTGPTTPGLPAPSGRNLVLELHESVGIRSQ